MCSFISRLGVVAETLNADELPVCRTAEASTTTTTATAGATPSAHGQSDASSPVKKSAGGVPVRFKSYHAAVAHRGGRLFIVSPARVRVVSLLGWRERVQMKLEEGNDAAAIIDAVAAYDGSMVLMPTCGASHATPVHRARAEVLRLLPLFIAATLRKMSCVSSSNAAAAATTSEASGDSLVRAVGAICAAVDAVSHLIAPPIAAPLTHASPRVLGAYLEMLVPHVLSDRLTTLPPDTVQAMVEHHASRGCLDRIERVVLHLDVLTLDINRASPIALCFTFCFHPPHMYTQSRVCV